ncbi:MAG: CapA family protein, partial [Clostridiales bacterium]|nr:CapA family protein [Clostridiales bacterium]
MFDKISIKSLLIAVAVLTVLNIIATVTLFYLRAGENSETEEVFAEEEITYENNFVLQESVFEAPEPTPEHTPEPTPIPTARLAFVGDLMCHDTQLDAARVSPGVYDFEYVFEYIAPYIQIADFAIGNLETTLSRGNFAGWPLFRSPASYAQAILNAGFDMVTTGNNHSFDGGVSGVRSTIEILGEVGLPFTGTYLSPEEREIITLVEVNGFTLAILNFTMHTNGIEFGENNFMAQIIYHDRTGQSVIDFEMIRQSMALARALNPDFIVVLPHIGIEYYGTQNSRFDTFSRNDTRWVNWINTMHLFLEEGADMVINHHPHTLLPAEFVYIPQEDGSERRTFMAYSLANFVSGQRTLPRETT